MRLIIFVVALLVVLKLCGVITLAWLWVFSPILAVVLLGIIGKIGSSILGGFGGGMK